MIVGFVWPEPGSSAAGRRTLDVIRALRAGGWSVVFSTPAREGEHAERLRSSGVACHSIGANDGRFDALVGELDPQVVIFDRFMIEEQFGWRVRAIAPGALRILDTIDLHFLRRARQEALAKGESLQAIYEGRIPLRTDDALRELAAIHRSDLAWLVSDFERELLVERFGLSPETLAVHRFAYPQAGPGRGFGDRRGFSMIGNFRHPPNWDGILWLREQIWPRVRAALPDAVVRIHGAYPPREVMALHRPAQGFEVLGWAEDPVAELSCARVNLAPLRFGAGIKGKIADGWAAGTPVVTTPIGAEGMSGDLEFGGIVGRDPEELAASAVALHEDESRWEAAREAGLRLLARRFGEEATLAGILASVEGALERLEVLRDRNHVGAMLWHQTLRSTEYFSRWIEEKNRRPTST